MSWYGPRERLLKVGASSLSDAELVGVIVATGASRESDGAPSVIALAGQLLNRFDGLAGVLKAGPESLGELKGLGPAKIARLLASGEIAARLQLVPERAAIVDSRGAYRLFSALAHEEQEVVEAAFLDVRSRVLRKKIIFRGSIDGAPGSPRDILREALRANAASFLVAHNHPSGDPEPSESDEDFTRRLARSAAAIGIPLLDHLVVGRGKYFSFADAGRLGAVSVPAGRGN